jgi:hypothetical protein
MRDNETQQAVLIKRRQSRLYITTLDSVGPYGPWTSNVKSHEEVVTDTISAVDLGRATFFALEKTQHNVPMPDYRSAAFKEDEKLLLAKRGMKSEREWLRGQVTCDVVRTKQGIEVLPYQKTGTHGAFQPMPDQIVRLPSPTTQQLGEAILMCLKVAEGTSDLPDKPPGYGHT